MTKHMHNAVQQLQQACVMLRKGRYDLWVQSPRGQWMVLSGQWRSKAGATRYATVAGYDMTTNVDHVLSSIERQLKLRFDNQNPNEELEN